MDEFQAGSRKNVEHILRRLGFLYSYMGTNLFVEAVLLCYREPDALTAVTKRVYPEIARQRGTRWRNVERNMRTALEGFWERGNRDFLNEMAGFTLRMQPSVGDLLNYIVGYIRDQELEQELEQERKRKQEQKQEQEREREQELELEQH